MPGRRTDGRWLYTFDLPEGLDPKSWKNANRHLLNVLDLGIPAAVRLEEEALIACQWNIALNDGLVERHGAIELGAR